MGHFYAKDGTPAHFQPNGKGTTIAHARKQELVPSVTGILGIVDKGGLTQYFINQHIDAAWQVACESGGAIESTSEHPETYLHFCKEVRQRASEHAEKARDKGSAIHNAIEALYMGKPYDAEHTACVVAVAAALSDVYGLEVGNCTPERTFATEAYGGAIDLYAEPSELHPNGIILDFKTKSEWPKVKKDGTPYKMWYDDHIGQLAAYREGIDLPKATCANVFIGPNAEVYIHEWSEEEATFGMEYFNACLALYKLVKRL